MPQQQIDTRRLKKISRVRASEEEVKRTHVHVVHGFGLLNAWNKRRVMKSSDEIETTENKVVKKL